MKRNPWIWAVPVYDFEKKIHDFQMIFTRENGLIKGIRVEYKLDKSELKAKI